MSNLSKYGSNIEVVKPTNNYDYYCGWDDCRKEVLKILKEPLHNCDLSIDYIDNRIIEK